MQELECGDVVVHPQHGPAAVRGFVDRSLAGRTTRYVELEALGDGMRIKAPVARLDAIGVRMPLTVDELDEVLDVLTAEGEPPDSRWTERMKVAEEQLATGRLEDAAAVARDVWRRERVHGVSYAEGGVKTRALRRVGLEVAEVRGTTLDAALALIESRIFVAEDQPVGAMPGE